MSSYNLDQSRFDEQRARMQDLEGRGVCFLCPDNVEAETRTPVLLESTYWYVKNNDFPYEGTKNHYMIVPKRHVTRFDELHPEEVAELGAQLQKTIALAGAPEAYSFFIRNGTLTYTGGTVAHLHAQLLVPDTAYSKAPSTKVKLMTFPAFDKKEM